MSQDRLDERGISRDEVVLYRRSNGEWTALETTSVSDAADGTPRFQAVSPGLSVFAIGSRPAAQQTTTEEPATTTEEPPETTEAPPETTEVPPETPDEDGGNITFVLLGLVIVAILVVAGLWYYRDRF